MTSENLDQSKLILDEAKSAVMLDMADIEPGTAITVEVTLTMDGREHVVVVTVRAEEDGSQGETGGESPDQEGGGDQAG